MADTQRKPGVPSTALRKDDYKQCFGVDKQRTAAQERIWNDIVMKHILTTSKLEQADPLTARDLAIHIYKQVS